MAEGYPAGYFKAEMQQNPSYALSQPGEDEIEKARGLARGLQPEKILAGQLFHGTLYFLVKWRDCTEMDVVLGHELGQSFPDFVISYYEQCAPFSVRHHVGKVPRPAPELPPLDSGVPSTDLPMDIPSEVLLEPPPVEMPAEPDSATLEVPVN